MLLYATRSDKTATHSIQRNRLGMIEKCFCCTWRAMTHLPKRTEHMPIYAPFARPSLADLRPKCQMLEVNKPLPLTIDH